MHHQLKRLSAPGFSFIELLLVVLLVSMAFVIFLGALSSNKQVNAKTRIKTIQGIMLNDIQEQIRSRRFDESYNGAFSTNLGPDQMDDYMLQFDGNNDYVINSNLNGFNFSNSNEITIETRFKLLGHSSFDGIVSMLSNGIKYRTMVSPGSNPYYDAGMHQDVGVNNFTFNINTWYHYVMVVRGGGNAEIYVNGSLISNLSNSVPSVLPNVSQILIGTGEAPGVHPSYAVIDDCRVWNIALSQEEIQTYMTSSPSATTSGLVGYWDFNEGSGNTVNDLSGNGNDVTVNGATWVTGSTSEQNLTDFNDIDDFNEYEIAQIDGYPGFSLSVQVDYVDPTSKFRSVMSSPTNYKRVITSIGHDAEVDLVDTLIFGSGL
ncbi:MAG: LamG domain-containing protein [Candidatus Neomarinimicrobiota bacterium]